MMLWIKILTDSPDHQKIKIIRAMRDGDRIALMWFLLLLLAGKCDREGSILVTEGVPYTNEQLSRSLGFSKSLVKTALETFHSMHMIHLQDGVIHVCNWRKYQSVDAWEIKRQGDRERKQKQREREKQELRASQQKDIEMSQKLSQGPDDVSRDVTEQIRTDEIKSNNRAEEKTTTINDVLSLLPSKLEISLKTVESLLTAYGFPAVLTAADAIASATAKGKTFQNPAGYFAVLCKDFDPPKGYTPPAERQVKAEERQRRKAAEEAAKAEEEQQIVALNQARESYWQGLSAQEQENWRNQVVAESPFPNMPREMIVMTAREMAWEACGNDGR